MSIISIECNAADNTTLEQLKNQIERRSSVLHETAYESTIALTIQTLKSLRAATSKSKGKMIPPVDSIHNDDLDVAIVEMTDLVVGFRSEGKDHTPCIRVGHKKGPISRIKPWWKINHTADLYTAKVFKFILSTGRRDIWKKFREDPYGYVVCADKDAARHWAETRFSPRVNYAAGLKRTGLSRAMMLASQRPQQLDNSNCSSVLNANVIVNSSLQADFMASSGTFRIDVDDNLINSEKVAGGNGAVNAAMHKAINSTNGYINKRIERFPAENWFQEVTPTPFPADAFQ